MWQRSVLERPVRGRRRWCPRMGMWWVSLSPRLRLTTKGAGIHGRVPCRRSNGRGFRRWWERGVQEVSYQRQETYGGRRTRGWDRDRGVDGRSVVFVERTRWRIPLGRRGSKVRGSRQHELYVARFRRRELMRRAVFMVSDVRRLYINFEAVLLPMYRTMGVWGTRERKVRASYRLFRYTVVGSVFRLRGLRYRTKSRGTTDRRRRKRVGREEVGNDGVKRRRWRGMFRTCAVKIPMVPVHVWLPEAHVEATTGGSVILAGVLLKVGTYGRRRRVRQRRPMETEYFKPRVYALAVRGRIYTARTARRQGDVKRVVAYASVSHMNRIRLGMRGNTEQGLRGAVRQMCSHGVVSGAMFRSVGVRYDRYHTRLVGYYGGRARGMPMYATRRRRRTRGNIGRPGTSAFVGEWRIRVGRAQSNYRVRRRGASGLVLGGAYSLWRYNRVVYGNRKRTYGAQVAVGDRHCRERRIRVPMTRRMRRVGREPMEVMAAVETPLRERVETISRSK
jgi:proton-translocating NADH-quinone oxidoreductase chain M